jgi:drug/metabolite transporter (DMT)-like permease
LALGCVSFLFGLSYVLTKLILNQVPVLEWSLFRSAIAAATLFPFLLGSQKQVLSLLKQKRFWCATFLGTSFNQIIFAEGLHLTTPSHSALINACIPAVTLGLAFFARRESWTWRKGLGIALAITGVGILISGSGSDTSYVSSNALKGDVLSTLGALSFALFLVVGQPLALRISPLVLTALYFQTGLLLIGLWFFFKALVSGTTAHFNQHTYSLSSSTLWLMVFVAITSSTVNYTLNNWALKRATPSKVSTYITTQPVIAAVLSAVLFHEQIGIRWIPSFLCVSAGILIATRKR